MSRHQARRRRPRQQRGKRSNAHGARRRLPRWIAGVRELWYGNRLVKRFRVPARNQERILESFEQEQWARRIDDPLPWTASQQQAKRRLRSEIQRLNGAHATPHLLRFRGDGTGRGIIWEPVGA